MLVAARAVGVCGSMRCNQRNQCSKAATGNKMICNINCHIIPVIFRLTMEKARGKVAARPVAKLPIEEILERLDKLSLDDLWRVNDTTATAFEKYGVPPQYQLALPNIVAGSIPAAGPIPKATELFALDQFCKHRYGAYLKNRDSSALDIRTDWDGFKSKQHADFWMLRPRADSGLDGFVVIPDKKIILFAQVKFGETLISPGKDDSKQKKYARPIVRALRAQASSYYDERPRSLKHYTKVLVFLTTRGVTDDAEAVFKKKHIEIVPLQNVWDKGVRAYFAERRPSYAAGNKAHDDDDSAS